MEVKHKNFKQCEMCKDEEATALCLDCYNNFCETCYKCIHDRKKNIKGQLKINALMQLYDLFLFLDFVKKIIDIKHFILLNINFLSI